MHNKNNSISLMNARRIIEENLDVETPLTRDLFSRVT